VIEMLLQADRLLTVDMVDQADAVYRRVAEQDPRNAIAVVGMARCALARGEDQEAYRLAARALDIDPENDMARRMTARMAEVLTYRGEAVPQAPVADAAPTGTVAGSPVTPTLADAASVPTGHTRGRSWLDRIRGR
jgi:thioredoxin-like negative regulator of GroEL